MDNRYQREGYRSYQEDEQRWRDEERRRREGGPPREREQQGYFRGQAGYENEPYGYDYGREERRGDFRGGGSRREEEGFGSPHDQGQRGSEGRFREEYSGSRGERAERQPRRYEDWRQEERSRGEGGWRRSEQERRFPRSYQQAHDDYIESRQRPGRYEEENFGQRPERGFGDMGAYDERGRIQQGYGPGGWEEGGYSGQPHRQGGYEGGGYYEPRSREFRHGPEPTYGFPHEEMEREERGRREQDYRGGRRQRYGEDEERGAPYYQERGDWREEEQRTRRGEHRGTEGFSRPRGGEPRGEWERRQPSAEFHERESRRARPGQTPEMGGRWEEELWERGQSQREWEERGQREPRREMRRQEGEQRRGGGDERRQYEQWLRQHRDEPMKTEAERQFEGLDDGNLGGPSEEKMVHPRSLRLRGEGTKQGQKPAKGKSQKQAQSRQAQVKKGTKGQGANTRSRGTNTQKGLTGRNKQKQTNQTPTPVASGSAAS